MSGQSAEYCLFDTAFGTCGIGWTYEGIVLAQLPEINGQADEMRLMRLTGAELASDPPPEIAEAIALLQRYFEGHEVDLTGLRLDLGDAGDFERKVLTAARQVGWGTLSSYGALARQVADVSASQAVGQAMAHNPVPIIVPCHRILAANGALGGFSAPGGLATKKRLLELEGSATQVPALAQLGFDF